MDLTHRVPTLGIARFKVGWKCADAAAVPHYRDPFCRGFKTQPFDELIRSELLYSVCFQRHIATVVQLICDGPAPLVFFSFYPFHSLTHAAGYSSSGRARSSRPGS